MDMPTTPTAKKKLNMLGVWSILAFCTTPPLLSWFFQYFFFNDTTSWKIEGLGGIDNFILIFLSPFSLLLAWAFSSHGTISHRRKVLWLGTAIALAIPIAVTALLIVSTLVFITPGTYSEGDAIGVIIMTMVLVLGVLPVSILLTVLMTFLIGNNPNQRRTKIIKCIAIALVILYSLLFGISIIEAIHSHTRFR